jgi:hypothetical protein
MELPKDMLIRNKEEFAKFYEAHENNFEVSLVELLMYLKNAADEIDRDKVIKGYENLLRVIPVDFLNGHDLLWLIKNTMDKEFWAPRVTSVKNKEELHKRYPDYALALALPEFGSAPVSYEDAKRAYQSAITPQDKILALRHLISMKSGHLSPGVLRH